MNEKSWKLISIKGWGGPRPYIPVAIETENGFIDRGDALIGGTGPHHEGWGGYVPTWPTPRLLRPTDGD